MSKNSRTVTSDRSAYSNAVGAAAKVLRSLAVAVQTRAKKKTRPLPVRVYAHPSYTCTRDPRAPNRKNLHGGSLRGAHPNSPFSRVAGPANFRTPRLSPPQPRRMRNVLRFTRASTPALTLSTVSVRDSPSCRRASRRNRRLTSPSRSRGRSWTRSRSTACRRKWPRPRAPPGCRGPPGDAR